MVTTLKEWELEKRNNFEENYEKTIQSKLAELRQKFLGEGFVKVDDERNFFYEASDSSFTVYVQLEFKKGKSLISWEYEYDEEDLPWACEDDLHQTVNTNDVFDEAINKVKEFILMQIAE